MPNSKKLLLVGWDAADWKIIHERIDAGGMPTVRRLIETGTMGNLTTLWPVLSPMLWTSIATGKRPHKHGIYGFTEPTPDGSSVQPMTNVSRRCKAIWNILNQHDMQSVVVGWWPSHPAEPINGAMVSDYYHKAPQRPGQAWQLMPAAIHPKRCFEELNSLRMHPLELTPEHVLPFVPHGAEIDQEQDQRLSMLMKMVCECTSIHTAATHLLETEPWDFAAVYYDAIDHFSHGFMKYRAPQQSHISDSDFRIYKDVVSTGYEYHDMMLARLLDFAGDDTTVILMSDHGFHPDHLRPMFLPSEPAGPAEEHRDYGIFVINGPGIKADHTVHGANLLDITPTILSVFDLPVGEDMDGRPLLDVFEAPREVDSIESWEHVEGDDGSHPDDFHLDPQESKEAMEQLIALGYIERPSDESEEAIAQCTRELDYNLARAYMDASMHGEALPILASLYRTYPLEFRFGIQLANCLQAMARLDDLQRLIDDLNERWRVARTEARERMRDVKKAARYRKDQWEELRKVDDEHEGDENWMKLARRNMDGSPLLFSESEKFQIRKLRAVARGNARSLDLLAAMVCTARRDFAGALENLQKAKATTSPNPSFQYHVGNAYLGLDRPEDAKKAFERALETDEFHHRAWLGLCRTYELLGDHETAAEHGRRSVSLRYHNPVGHYFLGIALERSGNVEAAIESYEVALSQNPNFAEAHDQLAELYLANGKAELASEHGEAARNLRREIEVGSQQWEPIELPGVDAETFREQLPKIALEEEGDTETFVRCLGQAPLPGASEATYEGEVITVVSGLPRSGTSLMMQMLAAAGLTPYTDNEREADESNPKGYYEAELVKGLAQRNDWVKDCAGHVVKVVAPLIPYLPQQLPYRIIFMSRDIEEIIASQEKMLERLDKSGGDLEREKLAGVFDQQVRGALGVASLHRIPVLAIPHAQVIAEPAEIAKAVAEFLDVDADLGAMAAIVDPKLHRARSGSPT